MSTIKNESNKARRERFRKNHKYGMVKIKEGQKVCFLSKENKHGFSLGLALGKDTIWLKNVRIPNVKELKRVLKSNVVIIEKKK